MADTDVDAELRTEQDAFSVSALLELEPSGRTGPLQQEPTPSAQSSDSSTVVHRSRPPTPTARPNMIDNVSQDDASASLVELPGPVLPLLDQPVSLQPKLWAPRSSTPMGPHSASPPKAPPTGLEVASSQDTVAHTQSAGSGVASAHAMYGSASESRAVTDAHDAGRALSGASEEKRHPAAQLGMGLPGSSSAGAKALNLLPLPQPSVLTSPAQDAAPARSPQQPQHLPLLAPSQPNALDWRAMPGFEELSESWTGATGHTPAPVEAAVPQPVSNSRHMRAQTPVGTAPDDSVSMLSPDERPAGFRSSRPEQRFFRTDSGLRAGPTSPSMRVPSHAHASTFASPSTDSQGKGRAASGIGSVGDPFTNSTDDRAALAGSQSALQRRPSSEGSETSTASGAKAGSKTLESGDGNSSEVKSDRRSVQQGSDNQIAPFEGSPAPLEHRASSAATSPEVTSFGTAREPDLAEQTFVEHSNIGSLPQPLKPAWARAGKGAKGVDRAGGDMFTPLKLQSMWRTPTPEPKPAGPADEHVEPGPSRQPATNPPTLPAAPRSPVEKSQSDQSTPGAARSHDSRAPVSEQRLERGSTPRPPSARFTFKSPEEVVAPTFHPGMQHTPSTPRRRPGMLHTTPRNRATPRTPRVPRTPNVPLRIFRTGRTPPQSARPVSSERAQLPLAKSYNGRAANEDSPREASRLAAEAAERRRKERDPKRLRLLAPLSPASSEGSDVAVGAADGPQRAEEPAFEPRFSTAQPEEEELLHVFNPGEQKSQPLKRDYAQEGTDFLARLQTVRLASEATSRSVSGDSAGARAEDESEADWITDEDGRAHREGGVDPRTPRRRSTRSMSASTYASLRAGAQAPTPQHGLYNGSPLRVSQKRIPSAPSSTSLIVKAGPLEESPRRMLRRFSAIDQAYHEYEAESTEQTSETVERLRQEAEDERRADEELKRLEAKRRSKAKGMALDTLPRQEQHSSAGTLEVSRKLHGNTAAQRDALTPVDSADPTLVRKSSMVHIGPEALPDDLDELGGGRMTFDATSRRWIKKKPFDPQNVAPKLESDGRLIAGLPNRQHMRQPQPNTEAFQPVAEATRETLASANDATPGYDSTDPFRGIESFGTSADTAGGSALSPVAGTGWSLEVESSRTSSAMAPVSVTALESRKSAPRSGASGRRGNLTRRGASTAPVARSGSALRNEIDLFSDGDSTQRSHGSTVSGPGSGEHRSASVVGLAANTGLNTAVVSELAGDLTTPPKEVSAQPASATPQWSPSRRSQIPRSILKARHGLSNTPEYHFGRSEARSISFVDTPDAVDALPAEHEAQDQSASGRSEAMHDASHVSAERQNHLEVILRQIADLALGAENESKHYASPANRARPVADETDPELWQEVTPTRTAPITYQQSPHSAAHQRSPWNMTALRQRRGRDQEDGEMSFLTNASFAMAHDRMVELIVDVAPWHEGWKTMLEIDLQGRRVESVVRLKDHLPVLQTARLDRNELSYLTGLPQTLRRLHASHNRIPSTISFSHVPFLNVLDISYNPIGSLSALSCLTYLQELRADATGINSIEGIEHLEGLKVLSLKQNSLTAVNLLEVRWKKLVKLNLRHNELRSIRGLGTNEKLRVIDLCHNQLSYFELGGRLPHLRSLKISHNAALQDLDVSLAPNLRALYADGCALHRIEGLATLRKLEELALRQQLASKGLRWPGDDVPDIRRLYLSGNVFPEGLHHAHSRPQNQLLNLVYLELAGCQLTMIPSELIAQAPNMRAFNLDHNLLSKLPPLQSMRRLKRLSLVGCRFKRPTSVIDAVQGMSELNVLDLRLNPCTLGLYPPLVSNSAARALPSEGAGAPDSSPFALLPPFPHPDVVQPDRAAASVHEAKRAQRAAQRQVDKSMFHKRRPGPALDGSEGARWLDDEQEGTEQSHTTDALGFAHHDELNAHQEVIAAADARFARTLPPVFAHRRIMHRGTLGMACTALAWLDGLLVDDAEVIKADELLSGIPTLPSRAFLSSSRT